MTGWRLTGEALARVSQCLGPVQLWACRTLLAVSVLTDQSGVTGDEEGGQRPPEPSRYPGGCDPGCAPRGVPIGTPVVGLVDVDDRDDGVDGVPGRVEARVAAGATGRGRHRVQALDIADRHHQVVLLREKRQYPHGHKDGGQPHARPPRLVPVFDRLVEKPVAEPSVRAEIAVPAQVGTPGDGDLAGLSVLPGLPVRGR